MKTEAEKNYKRAGGKFLQRFVEICARLLILRVSLQTP
jgi:hypothetical protein